MRVPHRARDPAADLIPPADEHPEDLRQATPEEVVALVGIEEHTATRERSRELQRVLDGHQRVVQAVPQVDLRVDVTTRRSCESAGSTRPQIARVVASP